MKGIYAHAKNPFALRRGNCFMRKIAADGDASENRTDENIISAELDIPPEKDENSGIINARPFLFAAASLAFSVFLAVKTFEKFEIWFFAFAAASLLAVAAVFCGIKRKIKAGVCVLIILAFFAGGYAYGGCKIYGLSGVKNYAGDTVIQGKVIDVKDRGDYAVVTLSQSYANGDKVNGKIRVYVNSPAERNIRLPETFESVKFTVELKKAAYEDRASEYLQNGIGYVCSPENEIVITGDASNIFERCRKYIGNALKSFISYENYGVVSAMLLGDTSGVDRQTLDIFRTAGIAHVFAVSGLHIGLFASALGLLCKLLKIKRLKRAFIVLIPTFIYVGACGFTPSAVRAFIMTAAIIFSSVFGVKHDGLSALSVAATVIMIANPFAIFEYGFLLSFAAVGGITLLAKKLERGAFPLPRFLKSSVSVCLAAQLGTLPVLTQMSGYISIISTFANILFLPVLSLIYQVSTILTVVSLPFYAFGLNAGKILLFVPDAVLSLVTDIISAVNYDAFALPFSFGCGIVFYYAALIFASDIINGKRINKFAVSAVSLVTCAFFAVLDIIGI